MYVCQWFLSRGEWLCWSLGNSLWQMCWHEQCFTSFGETTNSSSPSAIFLGIKLLIVSYRKEKLECNYFYYFHWIGMCPPLGCFRWFYLQSLSSLPVELQKLFLIPDTLQHFASSPGQSSNLDSHIWYCCCYYCCHLKFRQENWRSSGVYPSRNIVIAKNMIGIHISPV